MSNNLSKKIITTISYYDIMDYPMTLFEIWKYLIEGTFFSDDFNLTEKNNVSVFDIEKELQENKIKKYIGMRNGFYFLKGREMLVEERLRRNKISEEKFKKIRRTIKLIRLIPFVKMVAVAGRVAAKNAEKNSDLDIFVIFKKGRIFIGRFLVTATLHFIKKRRHGKNINNRICLNHFITDEYKIGVKDLYSSQVYSFLVPVFGENIFSFFQKENKWIKVYRPNFKEGKGSLKIIKDTFFSKRIRSFFEFIFDFDFLEKKMEQWQVKKIKNNPKTKKHGGMIIYDKSELAFWPDFQRQGPRVFQEFQERIKEIKNI